MAFYFYFSFILLCRHMIIIIAKKDRLRDDEMTLVEWLQVSRKQTHFDGLLQSCNDRIMAVDNNAPTGSETQELLHLVDRMVAANRGKHFTNKVYEEVSTRLWLFGVGKAAKARHAIENNKFAAASLNIILTILVTAGVFAADAITGPVAVAGSAVYLAGSWVASKVIP